MVGPNGHLLTNALAEPALAQALPVGGFTDLDEDLWLVFHQSEDWPLAFFAGREQGVGDLVAQPGLAGERLLPGLWVPRLLLDRSTYAAAAPTLVSDPKPVLGSRLRPISSLAVDEADALFHALFLRELGLRLGRDPELRQRAVVLAEERMEEVPPPQRLPTFLAMLADFGAHAMTVAQQILRSHGRAAAADGLCAALDGEVALFRMWGRVFGDGPYFGSYWLAGEEGRPARLTAQPLSSRDKAFFASEIFGGFWSGEAKRDFAWVCPRLSGDW